MKRGAARGGDRAGSAPLTNRLECQAQQDLGPHAWSSLLGHFSTWAWLLPNFSAATRRPRHNAHQAARRLHVRMLALLSLASIVFSLAQFIRSSCAEPPATKSEVTEAVRQELQRIDDAAAAASSKPYIDNSEGER